ncbi:MAG: sulfotransferase family protein [Gaiellaceae bacterium]
MSAKRRLVLVVAISRSGTSLFTGILAQLGFHVPQPEVKADDTNPRGFSEPRWVVDFHRRLMRERRVTVFDSRPAAWEITADAASDEAAFADLRSWLEVQFVGTDNVVVKDPRNGWFLPLWLRCADDLGLETSYVTMLRSAPEVVRSAREWYGTWQNDASRAASWLNYTLQTESATRGARRAFVRHEDLLADWPRQIARVGELLDIPWLAEVDRSRHPQVDAFIDPSLHRSAVGWDAVDVPEPVRAMIDDAWVRISRLAEPGGDDDSARASLDALREDYVRFYAEAEAISQSSVTAVAPRGARSGKPRAPADGNRPASQSPGADGASPLRGVAVGGRSAARGLARLPIKVALLLPPRYRERVPLPIVRAGLRVVNSLRRS